MNPCYFFFTGNFINVLVNLSRITNILVIFILHSHRHMVRLRGYETLQFLPGIEIDRRVPSLDKFSVVIVSGYVVSLVPLDVLDLAGESLRTVHVRHDSVDFLVNGTVSPHFPPDTNKILDGKTVGVIVHFHVFPIVVDIRCSVTGQV